MEIIFHYDIRMDTILSKLIVMEMLAGDGLVD